MTYKIKKLKSVLICVIVWLGLTELGFAANTVGVSIGTFGLGVRTTVIPQIAVELHYSLDPDFHTVSGRGCYNLYTKTPAFVPFVGAEYGIFNFNVEEIQGTGNLIDVFVGSEFALNKHMSLTIDCGYGYLTLESSGVSVSGPEWIFNIGLNYYFSFLNFKIINKKD